MKRTRQIVVTKRDGTVERFSLVKLTNCLANVIQQQGYDGRLARPLANAVAMHLEEWRDSAPPTTGYIYRCICSVLQQTGLIDVADELIGHRRERRHRRQQIRVVGERDLGAAGEPWRKAALVHTLEAGYGLRHAVARFMAGRIEERVFGLEYRAISKGFLRELVKNEVLAWGLADEALLRGAWPVEPAVGARQQPDQK